MKTNTGEKILEFIQKNGQANPKNIIEYINLGAPAVFRQLKKLQEQNLITKIGKSPKVFYIPARKTQNYGKIAMESGQARQIDKNYLNITPTGEILEGIAGFASWCQSQELSVEKTAKEYIDTLKKYNEYRVNDLIDGLIKMKNTFGQVYLDEVFYLDFYNIEKFGKTKLGKLILYGKQSQNKKLIKKIIELTKNKIFDLIKTKQIDALAFVPPTVPRAIQLQKELENFFGEQIPLIKINKITGEIPIPQKSLSKLEDRIQNAKNTMFIDIDDKRQFDNILIIDDAIGSGATINETAKKIKQKNPNIKKIIGLALVGSFKEFDVIQEI